ncbi:MAG: hypothetical protein ACREJ3_04385 [Polyangiaceae bacterium]
MSAAFDPVQFVAGTVQPMAKYTFPFICSIVGIESEREGYDVGTGFLFGESHHRSLPYGVMERDDDLPADRRTWELAMDYDPKNMRLESGGDASLVLPGGLSGSPVWRIGAYHRKPEVWTPDASRLVGVVTRWNQDKRALLATGIASLQKLLI